MIDRFKQLIRKNNIKVFFSNYVGTCIYIGLLTLYALIWNFEDNLYLAGGLFFGVIGSFFVETLLKKKNKLIGYIVVFIFAALFGYLLEKNPGIRVEMIYAGSIISLFLSTIYYVVKDKKDLADYITRASTNSFKVGLITGIVLMGTSILFLLIDYLLFSIKSDIYLKIVYLVLGLYTAPFGLMCLVDTKEPTMGFVDAVISKVFIPLMNIDFVIILLYIIRVIFTEELPKNEIYLYVAQLFIVMVPLAIIAKKFTGKYYEFNNKYLGYIFIAPMLLQIYSLVVRINQYGLTMTRYFGIFFIIFEIITIVLLSYRHQKYITRLLLVGTAFSVILLVLPYINVYESMVLYHSNVIKGIMKNREISDLSQNERKRIYTSYKYLDYELDSKDKVKDYVNSDNINEICDDTCKGEADRHYGDYIYYIYDDDQKIINIEGYKQLERIDTYKYDDFSKKTIEVNKYKVDISKYADYVLNHLDENEKDDGFTDFVKDNYMIKVNDKVSLCITYLNIRYSRDTDGIEYINLSGYLLYK